MSWTEALHPVVGTPLVGAMVALEKLRTGLVFNPTTDAYFADPYLLYERLRRKDPVHRSYVAGGWIVSSYETAVEVVRDPRFSADERNFFLFDRIWKHRAPLRQDPDSVYDPMLLRMDDPDHARLRGLVAKAFTPKAVEKLRGRIEEIVEELLDGVAASGHMEAIGDLAIPLPVTVIGDMLGIPESDRQAFKAWSADIVQILGLSEPAQVQRASRAEKAFGEYIEGLARQRRYDPGDDLLSALVLAEDAGERLSMPELVRTCVLLLVAGNETTTNLIGNGLLALARHPGSLAQLRDEPSLVPNAVDELLRYDSPVQITSRFATEPVCLAGRPIKPGQQVVLLLGAANRDPDRFARPDRLDLARPDARHHLSFSQGAHFCLGAQLARLEAQVVFQRLAERFPDLQAASGFAPHWREHTLLRGLEGLPVCWS